MYIKLTSIDKIDTNEQQELFTGSDANGIIIAIKQIHLYNEHGVKLRSCRITKEMIELLKSAKIQI